MSWTHLQIWADPAYVAASWKCFSNPLSLSLLPLRHCLRHRPFILLVLPFYHISRPKGQSFPAHHSGVICRPVTSPTVVALLVLESSTDCETMMQNGSTDKRENLHRINPNEQDITHLIPIQHIALLKKISTNIWLEHRRGICRSHPSLVLYLFCREEQPSSDLTLRAKDPFRAFPSFSHSLPKDYTSPPLKWYHIKYIIKLLWYLIDNKLGWAWMGIWILKH